MVLENKRNKLDIESERKKKTLSDEPKKGITCKTIQISIVSLIYYYIQVTNAVMPKENARENHFGIGPLVKTASSLRVESFRLPK